MCFESHLGSSDDVTLINIKGGFTDMAEVKKAVPELECENCGTTSELTPVLTYVHQGEEKHICTRCLPTLIHG